MNIEQAKQKIEELEVSITDLVWRFQEETGLRVERVDFKKYQNYFDGTVTPKAYARVEAKIPKKGESI